MATTAKNAVAAKSKGKNITQLQGAALMATVLTAVTAMEGIKEIGGDREKISLVAIGDFVIAEISGIREAVNFEGRIYELDLRDESKVILLGSTDLDRKIKAEHVGNKFGIFLVDQIEVNQASPMKSYRVFDFGDVWPDVETFANITPADESGEPLPF